MKKETIKHITVNTGEIKYSSQPAMFSSTGIGSCIVLFLYDFKKKIGGVSHIMLPEYSSPLNIDNKALFANTSPALLKEKVIASGGSAENLKAKIIGGANLFHEIDFAGFKELGKVNIEMVKKELIKNKIYLAAEAVGGHRGKTVKCCTLTGQVTIKYEKSIEKII